MKLLVCGLMGIKHITGR